MTESNDRPSHLDPSELGTKEYWDHYYQNDLDIDSEDGDEAADGAALEDLSELESWFSDVNAPAKVLKFLTTKSFPLSPNHQDQQNTITDAHPSVLDLGTGNGSALLSLRLEGNYQGPMVGVDYSQQSIELATKLKHRYLQTHPMEKDGDNTTVQLTGLDDIVFDVVDLIRERPESRPWWPADGFDLVLDKGTFDAISLSSEIITSPSGQDRRICEAYPAKVKAFVKEGGFLLVTSCNWTEEEVIRWFTKREADFEGRRADNSQEVALEVYDRINYPVFQFGGQKGQGVSSVCFRRKVNTAPR